ncbi:NUDIX domain-containing protein [Sporosalibacterium faouarense]|uniref:NUDIX domain-containing protein n=1 Tax=Sporosalibacterium faouarense TaxID=516123 RepID=UPI00192B2EE3|nr:NUDIX domain-containing protein [Sporosalibacterium faouarense]
MVNLKSYKNLRTVGVFILYKNTFAFMIGPNKSLDKLGIVRFGGHIEEKESAIECITREIEEETSSEVEIVNSPITYYKNDWDSGECIKTNDSLPFSKRPVIICVDDNRSTIIFYLMLRKS